ncbi:MAG: thioredoxin family protein [Candidatus Lernaella stagnicola]|nr:thioredoxin family protein [Candidatus Lernaella stagnicola]
MWTISSSEEFENAMHKGAVLVFFTSPWCAACHLQEPIIERLESRFAGKVVMVSVNVDQHEQLAQRFGIHALPTLAVFRNGKEAQRWIGMQRESTLRTGIETTFFDRRPERPVTKTNN